MANMRKLPDGQSTISMNQAPDLTSAQVNEFEYLRQRINELINNMPAHYMSKVAVAVDEAVNQADNEDVIRGFIRIFGRKTCQVMLGSKFYAIDDNGVLEIIDVE